MPCPRKAKEATRRAATAPGGASADNVAVDVARSREIEIDTGSIAGSRSESMGQDDIPSLAGMRAFNVSNGPEMKEEEGAEDDYVPRPGKRGSVRKRPLGLKRALSSMIHPSRDTDRAIKLWTWMASFMYVAAAVGVAYGTGWRPTFPDFLTLFLGLLVFPFFFTWWFLLTNANEIYRVRVKMRRLQDFLPASVPYRRVVNEQKAMQSISEVSAIRGTVMSTALLNLSASMFVIGTVAVAFDIERRQSSLLDALESRADAASALLLLTSVGVTFISNFEISSYDLCHSFMHYVGLVLALTGSAAYGIQQEWSSFSIAVTAVMYVFAAAWIWGLIFLPVDSSDVATVTFTSRFCIITELGVFFMLSILTALVIQGYDKLDIPTSLP